MKGREERREVAALVGIKGAGRIENGTEESGRGMSQPCAHIKNHNRSLDSSSPSSRTGRITLSRNFDGQHSYTSISGDTMINSFARVGRQESTHPFDGGFKSSVRLGGHGASCGGGVAREFIAAEVVAF